MRPSEGRGSQDSWYPTLNAFAFRMGHPQGAVVTQVIPRAARLRPIQHRVELCDAFLPHRVSRRLFHGPLLWPSLDCCGLVRPCRRRSPRQHPPAARRCRTRTLRRALEPLKSRSQRQRRHRRLISRPIRRAARRDWRARHGSNKLSWHQKSCNPWPSNWPPCARRRLTPE